VVLKDSRRRKGRVMSFTFVAALEVLKKLVDVH